MTTSLNRDLGAPPGYGRRRSGWTAGRITAVVIGGILALLAIGLIVTGGLALGAANSNGGWLSLGHGDFRTASYAVVTDPSDWSKQNYVAVGVDKVRVRVRPSNASTPVFVGLARPADVQRYLSGVAYATAHGGSNYGVTYTQHTGQAPAVPPANAIPWTAKATGTGPQTLQFAARQMRGNLVGVVMNADGSASVSGRAESAVTAPSLSWIGAGLLVAGIVLGIIATLLIIRPIRRAREWGRYQPPVEQERMAA